MGQPYCDVLEVHLATVITALHRFPYVQEMSKIFNNIRRDILMILLATCYYFSIQQHI